MSVRQVEVRAKLTVPAAKYKMIYRLRDYHSKKLRNLQAITPVKDLTTVDITVVGPVMTKVSKSRRNWQILGLILQTLRPQGPEEMVESCSK